MGRGLASTVIISSLFGDAGGLSGSILARANEFKQLDYSRELETEADKNGLQIMLDNAVNPQGMLELLQILKEENVETPRYMKYLSTHPDTDARIEAVLKHPGIKKSFETKEKLSRLFAGIKRAV
jgi:predicted Zn-dependent protease